jgi:hypothetical protein
LIASFVEGFAISNFMATVGVGRDLANPGVPGEGGGNGAKGPQAAIDPNFLKSMAGAMQ